MRIHSRRQRYDGFADQCPSVLWGECGDGGGCVINSWFDDETGEKNIELVWGDPLREVDFIANGMTTSELRARLEMEIHAWEMVKEKSEG